MATTTEKYYILQNKHGMFFQGLASRTPKKTPVKAIGLEIEYCDDPLHAARGQYEGENVPEELLKIAEFVNAKPRVLEITTKVKMTDGQPAPEPDSPQRVNFAGLAGLFAGFNLGE